MFEHSSDAVALGSLGEVVDSIRIKSTLPYLCNPLFSGARTGSHAVSMIICDMLVCACQCVLSLIQLNTFVFVEADVIFDELAPKLALPGWHFIPILPLCLSLLMADLGQLWLHDTDGNAATVA